MKVSKNFLLEEFVPKEVYKQFGEKSLWFINPKIIVIAQLFRDIVGQGVKINDWHIEGIYNESGLRNPLTTTGASFSQHKLGNAVDMKVADYPGDNMRDIIYENKDVFIKAGLTTLELDTPTWLHLDCRNTGLTTLFEVPYQ